MNNSESLKSIVQKIRNDVLQQNKKAKLRIMTVVYMYSKGDHSDRKEYLYSSRYSRGQKDSNILVPWNKFYSLKFIIYNPEHMRYSTLKYTMLNTKYHNEGLSQPLHIHCIWCSSKNPSWPMK